MKHVKLLTLALLILALALPMGAVAEEGLPFMQEMSQDIYISTTLLTTETYPEVCLSPYYFSSTFVSQYDEPYFMHFPCPANTFAADVDAYSALFLDLPNLRQYVYVGQDGYSYENFLNKCDVDEYILADGSDGLAIYIAPDRRTAYALIGVPEIDKAAKLEVRITDDSLRGRGDQEVIDSISEQIKAEVARIQATMTVELAEKYWSDGKFAGFAVANSSNGLGMSYTLPEGYFITKISGTDVSIAKVLGKNDAIEVDFDLDSYSYVDYQAKENPDSVFTVTIDENDYRVYAYWYNEEYIMSAYVDRVIGVNSYDQDIYLTLELDPEGSFKWTTADELVAELTNLLSGAQISEEVSLMSYRDATPYGETDVPAAQEEPAAEEAPAEDDSWVCPTCNETRTGKFCSEDGTARPE